MANEPDNLVLEHLRIMRTEMQDFRAEMKDMRGEMKDMRGEMKDMRGEMKDMRGDMDGKVEGLRNDIQGIRGEILGMRMDIHGIRKVQGQHSRSLESLEERFDIVREATLKSIGVATGAADRSFSHQRQIDALATRIEKLEQSK
jgi:chromosome segregation ATPase